MHRYQQQLHSSRQIVTELFDIEAFDQALTETKQPLSLFRQTLKNAAQTLKELFLAGRVATELVLARAHLVDLLIVRAWRLYFDADDQDIALVAVGGYGRHELHPGSDIDVLILLRDSDEPYKTAIEGFLLFLWDIGLEIGHSVRNIEECAEEAARDITVATNLQESRLLNGPQNLFDAQCKLNAPDQVWPGPDYFRVKLEEQNARHLKYHETAYNLEPNIKEGPGGLRDIQMIGWVAKRHFGVDTLHELVDHAFLTEQEYKTLHEGQAFLWQIRFGLHVLTGRREDRLLFDHQRSLARQFGYRDKYNRLAVEQFMKQYYITVMELSRLNEMLLQLFKEEILYANNSAEPVVLNKRFQLRKGFIEARHEGIFRHYPFALLEIFLLLQQHPEIKGVRANTIRLIRDHRYLIDESFRSDLRCRSLFMEIFRQSHGLTHELRRMNLYGILAAYIPAFSNIVGQMQHDLFHAYTVDEHTLRVIRNLRRFTVPEFRHEFTLSSELIETIPKQELLLLAGLFHDIAKGRGGSHSELGAMDATEFCQRHELSAYDTDIVAWLVKSHLLMSATAQRQDISDPDVVYQFALQVGDIQHLNYIYLLTVADIRATSDSVWNAWKDSLLKQLYHATRRTLRRGLDNPLMHAEHIAKVQKQARDLLEKENLKKADIKRLWDELGDEYFLRYDADEISWHTHDILHTCEDDLPLILCRRASQRGGTEIFIYTRNRRNLFATITLVLEQQGMNVVDARIFSSSSDFTLDTFLILDADNRPVRDQHIIAHLHRILQEKIRANDAEIKPLAINLPRQAKHFKFATTIHIETDEQNQRTILNITAYDRPGLLSRIATALSQCEIQIQNARIATYGERAEDIFFISDAQNQPVNDEKQIECLKKNILELLED
ncbi:[Protein-PII] uridylyltransferase / [Protein-PII]-UMP uridylyl-removing enzyme [hydrothermal vent metagenome]|uniref:[Protein-PII] uridylyltransferase / [Protein-PII]-UMP uridylyl-removing enzyme n=1 Tax=hydrothermal vent metagenome TaxID=652676 RepID=A0A3B1BKA8_9ZZZZ